MDPSSTALLGLSMFVIGACLGGYVVHYLETGGGGPRSPQLHPVRRQGFQWARSDFHAVEPILQETSVRLETDWRGSGQTDGHSVSFSIIDRDGIRRDLTFSAALLRKFLRSGDEGPRRNGFRGDKNEYGRLLSVAKYYQWVDQDGSAFVWRDFLATRERRLKVYELWLS